MRDHRAPQRMVDISSVPFEYEGSYNCTLSRPLTAGSRYSPQALRITKGHSMRIVTGIVENLGVQILAVVGR